MRFLLCLIGMLCFFVFIGGIAHVSVPENRDIQAMVKLCSAYFTYADTTHKTIEAIDKLCWRGPAINRSSHDDHRATFASISALLIVGFART